MGAVDGKRGYETEKYLYLEGWYRNRCGIVMRKKEKMSKKKRADEDFNSYKEKTGIKILVYSNI